MKLEAKVRILGNANKLINSITCESMIASKITKRCADKLALFANIFDPRLTLNYYCFFSKQ